MPNSPLVLVDADNLLWRSHFAHKHLHSSEGECTSVLYGFLKAIHGLKQKYGQRIVICWDHGNLRFANTPLSDGYVKYIRPDLKQPRIPGWRDGIAKFYKANRKLDKEREPAYQQLPKLLWILTAILEYRNVMQSALEADDLLGLIPACCKDRVLIFTGDQDMYQLLEEGRVEILKPRWVPGKGTKNLLITQKTAEAEYGFPMCRWAEYLALGADKSDNIKAVKGWGPKKAADLIEAGVDLRLCLKEQPEKLIEQLAPNWNRIKLIYELTRLPVSCDDPRIRHLVLKDQIGGLENYAGPAVVDSKRLEVFTSFCSAHDLAEFIADRHSFFRAFGTK